MRRIIAAGAAVLLFAVFFAACDTTVPISDGTYRVEMTEFDENGYKDFVEFVIEESKVVSIEADGYSETDGSLKTESEDMKKAMSAVSGTYPEKFYGDLVNEYIGSDGLQTDVVAGATMSSENFFELMELAKNAAKTGDTTVRVVESD